jgi:hypothetical protein
MEKMSLEALALARQLRDAGIPLDGEVLEEAANRTCSRLSVFQNSNFVETNVFDLESGGTGYILSVMVHNESDQVVQLQAFRLEIPWWENSFRWLQDPFRESPRQYTYSYPAPGPAGFERDVVLNHRLGDQGRIMPGDWLEGLLLGVGDEPIPEEHCDRQRIEMPLSIFDGQGNRYQLDARFYVSRAKRREIRQPRVRSARPRARIFAERDDPNQIAIRPLGESTPSSNQTSDQAKTLVTVSE